MVRQKRDARVPEFLPNGRIRLAGPGLHTGEPCSVTLGVAAPGHGWRLAGAPDVDLEIDGPEVPALDGSAAPFCAAVRALGLRRPGLPVRPLAGVVSVPLPDAGGPPGRLEAVPSTTFALEVRAHFSGLGAGGFRGTLADFEATLAPARTFGFLRDVDALRASGRALGATLETCLAFGDDGRPLNPGGLRFPDEPFRHKALDLLGDLGRLGFLPAAVIRAEGTGHRAHAELAARLAVEAGREPERGARAARS
jgi:UDP-3-O-[3-hydroxymyristoyl] N-acetylglucosamine deacetylase